VSLAADALGLLRLGAAVAMPREVAAAAASSAGSWGPLCLFVIAATSDFLDGRLARATSRPTAHGALLDTVADVSFVLAATGSGAAIGLVPWAAPLAIVAAVASYALASLRRSTQVGSWRLARSRVGHAAGVANYALAGLVAGAVALPHPAWGAVLRGASLGVVALNVAAVVARIVPARQLARGPAQE
jgi:phosphatidylglycerophosphate synthase